MKYFLEELKREWRPLRYWPSYLYSRQGIRWRLRNFMIGANREVVKSVGQLRDSPLTLFVCIFSLIAAYLIVENISHADLVGLLGGVMNIIVTLLSVLVAAAIFIATLHQKNLSRTVDEDMLLKKQLLELRAVFGNIYDKLKNAASDSDRAILFKAVAAVSVHNENDYRKFKTWHKREVEGVNTPNLQPYDRAILYPYDLVMQIKSARTYYIVEAAKVALNLLEDAKDPEDMRLRQGAESLLSAAERYHTAGTHGYYVPTHFAGRHLMRIVIYCLLALVAIAAAFLLEKYNGDLFPAYDLHAVQGIFTLSILLSLLALFLLLRHVLHFIKYLRDSGSYSGTMFDNFYIYEEDASAKGPDSGYPYARG